DWVVVFVLVVGDKHCVVFSDFGMMLFCLFFHLALYGEWANYVLGCFFGCSGSTVVCWGGRVLVCWGSAG
ncbi:hypothetical protein AAGG49_23230, partial [Stenotrophomonas maltophilia]|uniref:hypothetical protein n=1 Tax=Stenotrophomonas maltophilia TaxID=40324 RepID=UPI00313E3333